MLQRIAMQIIEMLMQVAFITYQVFPKTRLPQRAAALTQKPLIQILGPPVGGATAARDMTLYQLPACGKVRVAFR